MKILFLSHRIPYPPNKGDKIRSFHILKFIAARGRIFLGSLIDDPRDSNYPAALQHLCDSQCIEKINTKTKKIFSAASHLTNKPATVSYFHNRKLQAWVDMVLNNNTIDIIFCFSSTMAEYIFRSSSWKTVGSHRVQLLMDFCDMDSAKWLDYGQITPWPLSVFFTKEGRLLQQYEQRIAKTFNACFFSSSREKELFHTVHHSGNIDILQNGVDLDFFSPAYPLQKHLNIPTLVFTGAMDYHVNIDGICWFVKKIWPEIKNKQKNVQLYIVGSNPVKDILNLAQIQDIHVTGYVEDIRKFYTMATVCIAPLRIARGIQNKVLEALAMAKPLVCTSSAFEGISAIPGKDLFVCDHPLDFAEQVLLLLSNQKLRQQTARNGRKCMEQLYSWESQLVKLTPYLSNKNP